MRINAKALAKLGVGIIYGMRKSYIKSLKDNWQRSVALLTTQKYPKKIKSRLVLVLIPSDFISDIFLLPPERLRILEISRNVWKIPIDGWALYFEERSNTR